MLFAALIQTARLGGGTNDGLTWGELVSEIPTDPASVFTLLLLATAVGAVLWAGRDKPGGGGRIRPTG